MADVLEPTVDPREAGFDPERLGRIDALTHSYVDDGKFPCAQVLVTRGGEIVHHDLYGYADVEAKRPVEADTVFRIYSMTKPVTSVALMMLYEEGRILLENPVSRFVPAFADTQVWRSGDESSYETEALARAITIKDLLTHTSGLTYGFQYNHPVDAIYRQHHLGDFTPARASLTESVELLASLPLLFQPGSRWNYSMATDVLGAVVEAVSGQSLGEFFRSRIFDPLGMVDTDFQTNTEDQVDRLATLYAYTPADPLMAWDLPAESTYRKPPLFLSGGGGLLSTMSDYHRFTEMLRRRGELDGVRLLGSRTLDYMTTNHLPGGRTMNDMGQATFSEAAMEGLGFGLGFSVMIDPAEHGALGSVGDYGWGGAASTVFTVDPAEDMTFVMLTQLLPSDTYPVRRQLRAVVHQALL